MVKTADYLEDLLNMLEKVQDKYDLDYIDLFTTADIAFANNITSYCLVNNIHLPAIKAPFARKYVRTLWKGIQNKKNSLNIIIEMLFMAWGSTLFSTLNGTTSIVLSPLFPTENDLFETFCHELAHYILIEQDYNYRTVGNEKSHNEEFVKKYLELCNMFNVKPVFRTVEQYFDLSYNQTTVESIGSEIDNFKSWLLRNYLWYTRSFKTGHLRHILGSRYINILTVFFHAPDCLF